MSPLFALLTYWKPYTTSIVNNKLRCPVTKEAVIQTLEIISKLESAIDILPKVPGTKRALVDVTQLKELLTELRSSLPGELEEAQEVVQRRDELINQALTESGRIRSSIEDERLERIHSTDLVQEAEDQAQLVATTATNEASEVTEEAQRQAEKILLDAEKSAQSIRDEAERFSQERVDGANQYAQDVLFKVEQELSQQLGSARRGIEALQTQRQAQN